MTLYIDPPLWPAHGTLFSHLISDTSLEELHACADQAGLSRRAFDRDHYDVPAHRHRDLVSWGAVPVSGRELARILSGCGLRVRGVERAEKVRGRLELAWQRLGMRLGVTADGREKGHDATTQHRSAGQEWLTLGAELLDRWSEPHRHYHSTTHLASVLSAVASLHRAGELEGAGALRSMRESEGTAGSGASSSLAPVLLGSWFHDSVYSGDPGADEEASAALAEDLLSHFLPERTVAETTRLVRLTASHTTSEQDLAGAVLIDADLEVLARPATLYRRYVALVRADYAHVPDAEFQAGRTAVVDSLLKRPVLYQTFTGRRRWEAAARQNLQTEIQSLRSGRPEAEAGLGTDLG